MNNAPNFFLGVLDELSLLSWLQGSGYVLNPRSSLEQQECIHGSTDMSSQDGKLADENVDCNVDFVGEKTRA